jgi:hypothetical protein
MGNPEGEFQRVYQENIGVQVDEAIASSPLSLAVIELMTTDRTSSTASWWTGTPTELFEILNEIAETTLKINTSKIKAWPKSASYLSRRLNSIRTNLREKGIEIKIGDKDSQDKRLITISKVPSVASVPSKPDNLSTNQPQKVDGTENNDNVPSKVPSTNNEEIQAQNTHSRQHDSIDGTLHNVGGSGGGSNGGSNGGSSINNISRIHPHSDIWKCDCCNFTGDKWFMAKHPCKNNKKKIKENDE